jgi:hypothetical protein
LVSERQWDARRPEEHLVADGELLLELCQGRGVRARRWTRTALERLERSSPGNFGYSLFAVSRPDLQRLRDLHLEYVRAMQELIARSQPSECVGLYCSQLLDLADEDNALSGNSASTAGLAGFRQ